MSNGTGQELVSTAEARDRKEQYLQSVSTVRMGLAPRNFEEGLRMAELLAKSSFVPKEYAGNPGNVFVALQMGMELGLAPMQALQSIAVINGKPALYGDGLIALVLASGLIEGSPDETLANGVATCTVKRKGWPHPVTRTFSMEDAKRARLWGKQGPWSDYPERMLRMRARAYALRDCFADVLRGLRSVEELLDAPDLPGGGAAPVDPDTAIRTELQCTDEQWATLNEQWTALGTIPARKLVLVKQFAGRAQELIEALALQITPALPPSLVAGTAVTKHTKRRAARAKAEAHATPAQAPATPATPATPPPPPATTPAAEATRLARAACCEHGVVITDPCDACIDLADRLAASAPPSPAVPPTKVVDKDDLPF